MTTTATLPLVDGHTSTHRLGDPQVAGPLAVFPVLGPGLVAEVRPVEGQVGAVAAIAGRPVVLDLVARADVFASLLPRLTPSYA